MRTLRPVIVTAVAAIAAALIPLTASGQETTPPTTEFEDTAGANWTGHEAELEFLTAVDEASDRVTVTEIGRTRQDRPMHLVAIGDPEPRPIEDVLESGEPVVLFSCTFHGNEPAGREACLIWLRDLAFTDDPTLVKQLQDQTVLFFPTANPDGRAANTRGNSQGVDINRDHLNLRTLEAQALAGILREWQPDVAVDLHEYGPSLPAVYDDDLLYLWPRNLNTDEGVRTIARTLSEDYVADGVEEDGWRAGEYGVYAVGDDALQHDYHLTQSAGDGDEGIARNGWSLKHTASILLETAVTQSPYHLPGDAQGAGLNNRRVDTHVDAVKHVLRFMREQGHSAAAVQQAAAVRKAREGAEQSAPIYFNGQDADETLDGQLTGSRAEPTSMADPPPCGYVLTPEQVQEVALTAALHGTEIDILEDGSGFVSTAQPTEPLIGLLLDARGSRNHVDAQAVDLCGDVVEVVIEAEGDGSAAPLADAAIRAHLIGA